ncbi:isocitrate lyase/phosphoenolpyruvate mutase family protein [Pseudolactococcus reticulitermitis]|uniref:Phosphoenolpyruvate phosphomutase n=1 Tax=Pseudolactococcus reticulitermitis TaxID=2025039 RepID=A0A224WX34_9LACT|nr:isocitrate lyase/phosphoenolpyruvate mutase family protein [Lactococcus reticulitermitis]GAX46879.1 phosphoenolpyruvate phosphomutase [Lactococcus reticulitermitis]
MKFLEKLINGQMRIMECHDALSGMIASQASFSLDDDYKEFDGLWISSLCDSLVRGRPDMEVVDISDRLQMIEKIKSVSSKDIIVDIDSGGNISQLFYTVKTLSERGINGIVIEDKIGIKFNSLYGKDNPQCQDTIENFRKKISIALKARINDDTVIIARIESLTLGKGIDDAVFRGIEYIEAGAEALLIHCITRQADDLFKVIEKIKRKYPSIPIVAVPTKFPEIEEEVLFDRGVNLVIYANHLLRAIIQPMEKVAVSILKNGRTSDVEHHLISINEVLNLIPKGIEV